MLRFRYAKKTPAIWHALSRPAGHSSCSDRRATLGETSRYRKTHPDKERAGVTMNLSKRAAAEFFGTFWLVFGGWGSAVFGAAFPSFIPGVNFNIGFVGVSLAFGLTVLTMAFAIGHVSGCHLNPAVSIGLVTAKRFPISELPAYIGAQVVGAIAGSGVLYIIARGKAGFSLSGGFPSHGYPDPSPAGYP